MKKKAVSLLIAGLMVLEPCTMAGAADFSDAEVVEQNVEEAEEETAEPEERDPETEEPEETAEPEEDAEITEEATPEEEALSLEAADDAEMLQPEEDTFDAGEESEFSDNAEEASAGTYKNELKSGRFDGVNTLKWKVCGDSEEDMSKQLIIYGSGEMPDYKDSLDAANVPWSYYNDEISEIIIQDGVTAVGAYDFDLASPHSLQKVQLGKDVRKIGTSAFGGSKILSQVNFPDGLESIGDSAFNSTALQTVKLPDSVTCIGANAFAYCDELHDVILPSNLQKVEAGVFDCTSITRVVIPASVQTIGKDAFSHFGSNSYDQAVIQFTGTKEQWDALDFPISEIYKNSVTIMYNFDWSRINEHVWSNKKFIDNADSYDCLKGGTKSYQCIICGAVEETVNIPAKKAHSDLTKLITQAATINQPEISYERCFDCSYEKEIVGKKLDPIATPSQKAVTLNPQQKYTKLSVKYAKGDSVASWKSSNSNIVKVTKQSGGKCLVVAGKTPGKAVLTVTLKSKKTAKITVTVRAIKTTKITGVKSALTLKVKKTAVLKPVLTPRNSTEKITYRSSNTKIATVTSTGRITAKKKGTAYIYVKSGSKTVKCKVVVK